MLILVGIRIRSTLDNEIKKETGEQKILILFLRIHFSQDLSQAHGFLKGISTRPISLIEILGYEPILRIWRIWIRTEFWEPLPLRKDELGRISCLYLIKTKPFIRWINLYWGGGWTYYFITPPGLPHRGVIRILLRGSGIHLYGGVGGGGLSLL